MTKKVWSRSGPNSCLVRWSLIITFLFPACVFFVDTGVYAVEVSPKVEDAGEESSPVWFQIEDLIVLIQEIEVKDSRHCALTLAVVNPRGGRAWNVGKSLNPVLAGGKNGVFQRTPPWETFDRPVVFPPRSFPWLNSEDSFREAFFYEGDLLNAGPLFLTLDFSPWGKKERGVLPVYLTLARGWRQVKGEQVRPGDADLAILQPANGTAVAPGDSLTLRLQVSDRVPPPESIVIVTPNTTFEDKDKTYEYTIQIPTRESRTEVPILVMAVWPSFDEGDDRVVISKTLMLTIEPSECGAACSGADQE